MEPNHTHTELQTKLEDLGWSLVRIKQSGQIFIAQGTSPSGEKADRSGNSAAMALANLVSFARRHNQLRTNPRPSTSNSPATNRDTTRNRSGACAFRTRRGNRFHLAASWWNDSGSEC